MPVAAAASPGEYKQVTVLFADVVRSMEIAAALGTERLREVMTELVNRSSAVIQRYGGTLDKFTGDGIMALFGAPIALEDHAFRACLAACDLQEASGVLAAELERRDGIVMEIRVGLNSGEVIAGAVGSHGMNYTAVGEQVGMAQRMESVAPPGGVMLSESTAKLVQEHADLSETVMVRIKGREDAVPARLLRGVGLELHGEDRPEVPLIGRGREAAALSGIVRRALGGEGAVVGLVGPPGIGKSRLAREVAAAARCHGAEVFATYCESHTRDIPYRVIARLLRVVFAVGAMPPAAARSHIRVQLPHAEAEDLLLLDDLLGIGDSGVALPEVSPDARRRRLTALLNQAVMERRTAAAYVIEDVHWIDDASEAILAGLASGVLRTASLVAITYRPEYRGRLFCNASSETITLEPLTDADTAELARRLLGGDPSVSTLSALVTERSAGNPFFAEEIVRDLAERHLLQGERGRYLCGGDIAEFKVPATLQAAIGARIDRLSPTAKGTLQAASVIGARFDIELLTNLVDDPDISALAQADLIDRIRSTPRPEYSFRHPLIQKVAYESQLKSARSQLHRRLAAAIERRDPGSADDNAAMIAFHLSAAGDLRSAYAWHMRAGAWLNYRDVRAARASWTRARDAADKLPTEDPDHLAMQIAPRTLLCASTFRVGGDPGHTGFADLRELATTAHDNVSLAIGMAGHLTTLAFNSRYREATHMASELDTLIAALGNQDLAVALLALAAQAKYEAGQVSDCMGLAQRVIDLAAGDATRGDVILASPLAWALGVRGVAKQCLGLRGWKEDIQLGMALARPFDATTRIVPALYRYAGGILNGAVSPTAADDRHTAELLEVAERSGDDTAVALAQLNRAAVLSHRDGEDTGAEDCLTRARNALEQQHISGGLLRMADLHIACLKARSGATDSAIEVAAAVLDEQFETGDMISRGVAATILTESLLRRGGPGDRKTARDVIQRFASVPAEHGFAIHEVPLLRLRALLAQADGDPIGYRTFVDEYRSRATAAGFEGHIALADAMPPE